jgi:hypothetical protein
MTVATKPTPLVINNNGVEDVVVQNQTIPAGGNYTVPAQFYITWGKDAYLRFLVDSGDCSVVFFGVELFYDTASIYLSRIGSGDINIS